MTTRALGPCAGALLLALASPALSQAPAQGPAPGANVVRQQGGPGPDGQTAFQSQVRAIEEALRQSQGQLDAASTGSGPPNYEQARVAVRAGTSLMSRMPTQQQNGDAVHRAAAALKTAEESMEGGRTEPRIVSANLRNAAEALAAVHGDLTAGAGNAGPQQGAAGGARRPGG